MKKILNDVENVLSESLAGFAAAHRDLVVHDTNGKFLRRAVAPKAGKVALISGGGSGHEPMHTGFVGEGMLDAACPGEVFTSPTPDQMIAAAEAVDTGGGVLFIVKNYAGDVMNFEMATEMADGETAMLITNDDVAVEDSTHSQGRRGVAGTVIVEKIVGAAAEAGQGLQACKTLGEQVNANTGSMAIALSSCIVPAAGTPTFTLNENQFELGVGIHGEPGRQTVERMRADEIAETLLDAICAEISPKSDEPLLLLCNGLGATPMIELYLLYHAAEKVLAKRGLKIARSLVGNYCTSLEMQGASLTLTRLTPEMLTLWDAPVVTSNLRWGK